MADGLGLRRDCRSPHILLLLEGARGIEKLVKEADVIIACGKEAVLTLIRSLRGAGGLPVAATGDMLEEVAGSGFIPVPEPLVTHLNIVTCLEPELLPLAVHTAKRAAECLVLGRCLPPFTRLQRVKR